MDAALLVRAWIEIITALMSSKVNVAALLVRAWIEMVMPLI